MTAPADREFEVLARGYIRDRVILANWRAGLRQQLNPSTGVPFTEDEIAVATQYGSRWWIQADADDLLTQLDQRAALYLADQMRIERANSSFLLNFHAPLWAPDGKLPATGSSGSATVAATPGTIVRGSTTIGDPYAYWARDSAGKRYQVFTQVVTPANGVANITLAAIDTGAETNILDGSTLTWITRDPGMDKVATATSDFTGGTNLETDAEFAQRMLDTIRHKQGAGNDAHFRAWLREASNAVEDGFVYPCALNAGSVICAITQKRGDTRGPLARIPGPVLLAQVRAHVTPPNSPTVPVPPFVAVVPTVSVPIPVVLRCRLQRGALAGFADATPFPSYNATTPQITTLTTQTDFRITAPGDATLPGQAALATLTGTDAPALMVWHEATSSFEELAVLSVEDLGGSVFRVLLTAPPTEAIALFDIVSPLIPRHAVVSQSIENYFDEVGTGDFFDVNVDPRGARCIRFPNGDETKPQSVGGELAVRVMEDLGAAAANATVEFSLYTTPPVPTDVLSGPNMLTLGDVGVYLL